MAAEFMRVRWPALSKVYSCHELDSLNETAQLQMFSQLNWIAEFNFNLPFRDAHWPWPNCFHRSISNDPVRQSEQIQESSLRSLRKN